MGLKAKADVRNAQIQLPLPEGEGLKAKADMRNAQIQPHLPLREGIKGKSRCAKRLDLAPSPSGRGLG